MTDMLRLAEETFKLVQIYAIIEEQAITKKIALLLAMKI